LTELTEGGVFDTRDMKADEGELFREVTGVLRRLFLKELSFQPRLGCKSLSHTPAHGRVYLRKSLRVGVRGEKVDFFEAASPPRSVGDEPGGQWPSFFGNVFKLISFDVWSSPGLTVRGGGGRLATLFSPKLGRRAHVSDCR